MGVQYIKYYELKYLKSSCSYRKPLAFKKLWHPSSGWYDISEYKPIQGEWRDLRKLWMQKIGRLKRNIMRKSKKSLKSSLVQKLKVSYYKNLNSLIKVVESWSRAQWEINSQTNEASLRKIILFQNW